MANKFQVVLIVGEETPDHITDVDEVAATVTARLDEADMFSRIFSISVARLPDGPEICIAVPAKVPVQDTVEHRAREIETWY